MKTTDVLGCVGSATFLLLAVAWVPLVGPFFSLLTPLPFLYYATKLGTKQGVGLLILSLLVIGLIGRLTGHPQSLIFALEFSVLGLVLSELFRRGLSLGQTIFLATLFMLAVGFGFLWFIALQRHTGPLALMEGFLRDNLRAAFSAYEQMGIPPEQTDEFQAYGDRFIEAVTKIYPALMVVGTGFAVWLNVVLAKFLFRLQKLEYPKSFRLDRWRAPEGVVWVLITSGFALFLTSGSIKWIAINTLIIVMTVYVFHGLSILVFFFNKYHVPSWLRVAICGLIIIQQVFLALLALAGLFDQWIDFRKIHRKMDGPAE